MPAAYDMNSDHHLHLVFRNTLPFFAMVQDIPQHVLFSGFHQCTAIHSSFQNFGAQVDHNAAHVQRRHGIYDVFWGNLSCLWICGHWCITK